MTLPLDIAIRGSIVLALGLLANVALRRHPAALRHVVLAVTLCAAPLVTPVGRWLPAIDVAVPTLRGAVIADPTADTAVPRAEDAASATSRGDAVRPQAIVPAPSISVGWRRALIATWVLGTVVALLAMLASLVRMARQSRRAPTLDDGRWREAVERVSRVMDVRRPVSIRDSGEGGLVGTWGVRRPVLLVPREASTWAWQVYASVVCALFWWNPLAWIAASRLAIEGERACDEVVVAGGVPPVNYAAHLLAVARGTHATAWDAARPMARPSTLHRRISAMLDSRTARRPAGRSLATAVSVALLAVVLSVGALRASVAQDTLEGVVYDPTGAVVPEAALTLNGTDVSLTATSDAEGRFSFPGVTPGRYLLEARLPGFKLQRQTLELRDSADWTRVVALQLGVLQETINVRASRTEAPSAAPSGPVRVRVGGNIMAPRKVKDVKPIYPDSMRQAGTEGVVTIDAVIGRDGSVTTAQVTSPQIHPDLALAALEAVRQWKFTPTLLNGAPVDVIMGVSVSFMLE